MLSHFGFKKIAWLGLAKNEKLLVIVQQYIQKTTDPFFRFFEKKKFKVWVKSIKIYSYFHLKYIFRPVPYLVTIQ
jgi:hypothetical protein